jgi:membrane protein DedA with SNARE-associated domain
MGHLLDLIGRYGVWFVFGNVLLEQIGLPLPALPTLLLAGALAADGRVSAVAVLAAAVVASMIADSAWYVAGRRLGNRVLRLVCRVSLSPDSCVRRTESVFERFGLLSLLLAKFIPGYSTVAPPLAGIVGTKPITFLAYNAAGALVWAAVPVLGGMAFHGTVDRVIAVLDGLGSWGLAVLGGSLLVYVLGRWARLKHFQRALRIARISVEDLWRLMNDGHHPIVLDVRTSFAHAVDPRTIPGAVRFHIDELDAKLAGIPKDQEIILFCT